PLSPHLLPTLLLLLPLHSFPTRRSSDLIPIKDERQPLQHSGSGVVRDQRPRPTLACPGLLPVVDPRQRDHAPADPGRTCPAGLRSEEHTSELQSRFDLVCRLLLEKKNSN